MSKMCRVLKSGKYTITQEYNNELHKGIDIVKEGYQLDYIVAHSDGIVVQLISNCTSNTPNDKTNPGNMIKLDHGNGYYTRYLHLAYNSIDVNLGDKVKKGQILGYMGNTGYSFGGHLHFEVLEDNIQIDPTFFLDNDFIKSNLKYKIGDTVTFNGVYVSSDSSEKLTPRIKTGTITKIIENAKNPYLIDDGNIGWVNDDVIVETSSYLSNPNYKGESIVDALKQIGVDSSYNYRSKLAEKNNIFNYNGTSEQNIMMLNLLKKGILKNI